MLQQVLLHLKRVTLLLVSLLMAFQVKHQRFLAFILVLNNLRVVIKVFKTQEHRHKLKLHLNRQQAKFKKNQKRRELLNLITSEVLNPTPSRDKWGFAAQTTPSSTAQDYQNAVLRAQMNAAQNSAQQMYGYQDPRALYQGNRNV
jgi:hypothetical protein